MALLNTATALKVGSSTVAKVYAGAVQVWPTSTPSDPTAATLTIGSGKVASTLTNFPVRVDLAHMPDAWWTGVATDGGNVRVKASGSVIPFDLVTINTTAKTGELFFKAPALTTSTNTFTLDKSGSSLLAATDPNGRNAVWADYQCMFAFPGGMADRAGKCIDAYVRSGTLGSPDASRPGWLNPNGSAVVMTTGVGHSYAYTMGASYVPNTTSSTNRNIVAYSTDTGTDAHRETLTLYNGVDLAMWNSTNDWNLYGGGNETQGAGTVNAEAGLRERAVMVKDEAVSRYIIRNGVKGVVDSAVNLRPGLPGNAFFIGAGKTTAGSLFSGDLNYAYLRHGTLTDDWIAAEYASWETPASFYTVA